MDGKQFNVVVAGSDSALNHAIAEGVRQMGDVVASVFTDGVKLLERISDISPDVVIADVILSGTDGFGVLQGVKNALPETVCVMTSGTGASYVEGLAYEYGADYYITKPFDAAVVASLAHRLAAAVKAKQIPKGSACVNTAVVPEKVSLSLEGRVTELLNKMHMPMSMRGYYYIRDAVVFAVEDASCLHSLQKTLYVRVADNNNTKSSLVERSIRHAVETVWSRGNVYRVLGMFNDEKPSNGEFLSYITDKIRLAC